jgi:hypothetical protein
MRRIVLLWLILTPLWIAFSFYASASKIAFIPPALAVIALVLHWLHKHFVIAVAGEPEPRAKPIRAQPVRAQLWPSRTSRSLQVEPEVDPQFDPQIDPHVDAVEPVAVPSRGLFRPALLAVGVGACVGGAAIAFFQLDRPASNNRAVAHAPPPSAAIGVPTEALQSQSFAAEPKPIATEAVKPQSFAAEPKSVPAEAVKPQSFAADTNTQANSTLTSSENADAKRAEAQLGTERQTSSSQLRCNVSLCESSYQSFRASDCSYQPFSGPRQYCAR